MNTGTNTHSIQRWLPSPAGRVSHTTTSLAVDDSVGQTISGLIDGPADIQILKCMLLSTNLITCQDITKQKMAAFFKHSSPPALVKQNPTLRSVGTRECSATLIIL